MPKHTATLFILLCILLGLTYFMGCKPDASRESPSEQPQEDSLDKILSETIIHNQLKKAIHYSIRISRPGEKSMKKIIMPDNVDRYPGDLALELTFKRDKKAITYRLNPGILYSFRYDKDNKSDVFTSGREKSDIEEPVPFVTTPMDVVERMLEMAGVNKDDILYDLGCGDGRIVIMAARKYGAQGVGIDLDPRRIRESNLNAEAARIANLVEFRVQDVFNADFTDATVVTLYLIMDVNEELRPHLERQLKNGTYVVSHSYPIPGWAGKLIDYETMQTEDGEKHFIYLYQR